MWTESSTPLGRYEVSPIKLTAARIGYVRLFPSKKSYVETSYQEILKKDYTRLISQVNFNEFVTFFLLNHQLIKFLSPQKKPPKNHTQL